MMEMKEVFQLVNYLREDDIDYFEKLDEQFEKINNILLNISYQIIDIKESLSNTDKKEYKKSSHEEIDGEQTELPLI